MEIEKFLHPMENTVETACHTQDHKRKTQFVQQTNAKTMKF